MKKPKAKKPKKSVLTLPLQGDILTQLDKVKELSAEKTSAGAIRFAIQNLPAYIAEIDKLNKELEQLTQRLERKQDAVNTILESFKRLTSKK